MSACVTATFAPSNRTQLYRQKIGQSEIQVYRSQIPQKKFIEIGSVNVCCMGNNWELIDKLKLKAAIHGGDAIIHLEIYHKGMSATVIKFID
jgi:hypothetical protein